MSTIDRYKDKYFSVLGDSISTLEWYSRPREASFYDAEKKRVSGIATVADTWWGNVIARLGGRLLVNDSWSGSTVSESSAYFVPSYGCSDERTSSLGESGILPDVVIVFMGINDWGVGFNVGESLSASEDCSSFSVAYRTMLEKIKTHYPKAEIWCMTLPYGCRSGERVVEFSHERRKIKIEEYCEAIRRAASALDCRIVDLYEQRCIYDTIDGYHPNKDGMEAIAHCVLSSL